MQRNAWHLTLRNQQQLAIAQQQVVEYLAHTDTVIVPDCHERCSQVLLWRGHVVPVLGAEAQSSHHEHLIVVAYVRNQAGKTSAERIALALANAPAAIAVKDDQQCDPTEEQSRYWGAGLLTCFLLGEDPVAIVDFATPAA